MKRVITTLVALVCFLALGAQTTVVENPQTDAVYRLPMEKGVQVVAYSLTPIQLGLGHAQGLLDFCAWEFMTTQQSAIFAPRDGVVEEASESRVLILHKDGIYTQLRGFEVVNIAAGDSVKKGDILGNATKADNKWCVRMEVFHLKKNPNYGKVAQNGSAEHLKQYINPIFATRSKCKVLLTNGNSYTVKARTWCWPWE